MYITIKMLIFVIYLYKEFVTSTYTEYDLCALVSTNE